MNHWWCYHRVLERERSVPRFNKYFQTFGRRWQLWPIRGQLPQHSIDRSQNQDRIRRSTWNRQKGENIYTCIWDVTLWSIQASIYHHRQCHKDHIQSRTSLFFSHFTWNQIENVINSGLGSCWHERRIRRNWACPRHGKEGDSGQLERLRTIQSYETSTS